MKNNIIYLDHNATTIIKPDVIYLISDIMQKPYNASSVHNYGRKAKHILEESRQKVAKTIGTNIRGLASVQVIFVSSGTEANNMAIRNSNSDHVFVSAIEHPSILNLVNNQKNIINVKNDGTLDLGDLDNKLKSVPINESKLLSVMLVNNETGIIQPIYEIAQIVHKYNGILHCDAIQAIGKIPVDFYDLDVDMMTICGHKIGGPQGIGALIFKKSINVSPLLYGGGQEFGYRASTESIALIAGFAKACDLIEENLIKNNELLIFRKYCEDNIKKFDSNIIIVGENSPRVANTIKIINPKFDSETQLIQFDLQGFCLSNGSACSSGKIKNSYVLEAMGYNKEYTNKSLRVSMGYNTKFEEIEAFVNCWKELNKKNEIN